MYSTAMIEISVVIFCVISTVFSHEEQTKMKPLLLTTQEGPAKDTLAKIAAAYTVSIGLWLMATLIAIFLHWTSFELNGLELSAGDVIWHSFDYAVLNQPIGIYIMEHILISLLAIIELCAITLAVSARSRSSFHSVCVSGLCWMMPVLAFFMIRGSYSLFFSNVSEPTMTLLIRSVVLGLIHCLMYSSPFYLVYPNILAEISSMGIRNHGETGTILLVVALACIVTVSCTVYAYLKYRKAYHFL